MIVVLVINKKKSNIRRTEILRNYRLAKKSELNKELIFHNSISRLKALLD